MVWNPEPKELHNHLGVPLSLLSIENRHEYAVIEMGASHVGEIRSLAALARPAAAVVTRIGPAHLAEFGSVENICRAKGELVEAIPKSGVVFLNGDDERVSRLSVRASARVLRVGQNVRNDVVIHDITAENVMTSFRIRNQRFRVPAVGRHHALAAGFAVAVGQEFGLTDEEIADGLATFVAARGRCWSAKIGDWTVIDDTYNANPESMHAACNVLCNWQSPGRRIMVVGDMLSLGPDTAAFHHQLGTTIAESRIDRMIAVGDHASNVVESARKSGMPTSCLGECRDIETAVSLLDLWLSPNDVVLVKGSRAMQMERVVASLRAIAEERTAPPIPIRVA